MKGGKATRAVLLAVLVTGVLPPSVATAQPADAHAAAEAIVRQLDAGSAASPAAVSADAEKAARAALDRASALRGSGDEPHALAADALALEWAQTARDVRAAAEAEQTAADARKKAVDAQAQLERTRGLVEAALATVGRLQAELAQAEAKAGGAPPGKTAVEVHDDPRTNPKPRPGAKKPAVPASPASPTPGAP